MFITCKPVFLFTVLKMTFLNGILVDVFGHKLESPQTRVFVWFPTLIFHFYKTLFMNRLELSCFTSCTFKTRIEDGFLSNPPEEETVNSISGFSLSGVI
jgi:hypothetical protein